MGRRLVDSHAGRFGCPEPKLKGIGPDEEDTRQHMVAGWCCSRRGTREGRLGILLMIPPHGDGGRRFMLFSGGGNMNQPPPGAARAGAASVELGVQVEAEDGAVTRRAPLVGWEEGIDAVVG